MRTRSMTMRVRVSKANSESIRALGKANGKTVSEMATVLLEDALALRAVVKDRKARKAALPMKSVQS